MKTAHCVEKALQTEEQTADAEADIPVVRLKNEQGHFKTEAKVCIMALLGECEIPAHRCGTVIQTVVQQICGARVPDNDLHSVLRYALLTKDM